MFFPMFSFDWGGSLDTSFSAFDTEVLPTENTTLTIGEKATLWGKLKINETLTFQMEGSYDVSTDFENVTQSVNLDFFQLKMSLNPTSQAKLDFDLGRFSVADSSKLIFNNLIDGGRLKIDLSTLDLALFAGYTGLLNGKKLSVVNSSVEIDPSSLYSFAPGYVAAGLSVDSKNILGNHLFGCEVSAFIPVDSEETRGTSAYVLLKANGPISKAVYYDAFAAVSLLINEETQTGIMANGVISYYPSFIKSYFTGNVTFATDTFVSFVDPRLLLAQENTLNGLLKIGMAGNLRLVDSFLISVNGDYIMKVVGAEMNSDSIQWTTSAVWNIFSDFQINMNLGQRIPLVEDSMSVVFGGLSLAINF